MPSSDEASLTEAKLDFIRAQIPRTPLTTAQELARDLTLEMLPTRLHSDILVYVPQLVEMIMTVGNPKRARDG